MIRELCTYFDRRYLPFGLSLYRSLARQSTSFRLWTLVLDDAAEHILRALALPQLEIVTLKDLIEFEPRLREAQEDRPVVEFYYACTPRLIELVRERTGGAVGVTYVDADMYFFADLDLAFPETEADVHVVDHRSMNRARESEHGIFNVCWVHFEPTDAAVRALQWWGARTLESTRLGGGVWGDQKYLDDFPRLCRVHIHGDGTVGLAPWNLFQHTVTESADGVPRVDGQLLVVFHFARYLYISPRLFVPIRRQWIGRSALLAIYRPYQRTLAFVQAEIKQVAPQFRIGYTQRNLRGLVLSVLTGRVFAMTRQGPRRVGLYFPSTRDEVFEWRADRRRARLQASAERAESDG